LQKVDAAILNAPLNLFCCNGIMINSQSLREQIYAHLRNEIMNGTLKPGASINMDNLSKELSISKTPLREALVKLECQGFVEMLPRKGVQVKKLTYGELKEYYEIIGFLESAVVYSVFDQIKSPSVIEKMKQSNAQQKILLKNKEFDLYYQLNWEFHDIFLTLSNNKTLQEIVVPLKKRLYDFPWHRLWEEWEKVNLDEHDKLIANIEKGDRSGAAAVIRDEHWGWKKHEAYFIRFYKFDSIAGQAKT
jgi:DNA-binding GntR family transcriptional regulator